MSENTKNSDSSVEPAVLEMDGEDLLKLLIEHPERTDELEEEDWQKLNGD